MQIFSLIVAATAVWVFIRYSPFDNLHKFLFVFGYFLIYEYSVMARPYGVSLLLVFLFCLLFPKRKERFFALSLVVFLLSNSSPVGLIAGGACMGLLLFDSVFISKPHKPDRWQYMGFIVMAAGILISFASMAVGTQSNLYEMRPLGVKTLWRPYKAFAGSFFPFPQEFIQFLAGREATVDFRFWFRIVAFPSVFWLAIRFCKAMAKSAHALSFYILGSMGLFFLFAFAYSGSLRHHGFFFVFLIASLWICATERKEVLKSIRTALTITLSAHLLAGAVAVASDNLFLFSNGKRTAKFIKKEGLNDYTVIAYPGTKADAIMVYMKEIATMFYPTMGKFTSFYDLGPQTLREDQVSVESVLQVAKDISGKSNRQTLLILNREVDKEGAAKYKLVPKGAFAGSIKDDESFYLYEIPGGSP